MDRNRQDASGRSDLSAEERWLREALAPEAGAAERVVARALATAGGAPRRARLLRWGPLAAAAALALAFGWAAFFLRPGPPAGRPGGEGGGATLLLTNAGGAVRLVRAAPEASPLPPVARPAAGGCTTVYWSRGSVLAVYESCGDGTIRIEGGAS